MAFYLERENFIRNLAINHYQVKHNRPVSDEEPTEKRRSFFRINDEEEMNAAAKTWIHFPCVVMVGLQGGLVDKKQSIRQGNVNTMLFLHKVSLDASELIKATAISICYDKTFDIMQDFIAKILADFEDEEECSVFQEIEPSSFKWEQYGPTGDDFHGWILTFKDETKQHQHKPGNWLSETGTEEYFILADDDGQAQLDDDGNTIRADLSNLTPGQTIILAGDDGQPILDDQGNTIAA